MVELERSLVQKIGLTPQKAAKRTSVIAEHFRDAIVDDADALIPAMLNDAKDRHVSAAAVRVGAEMIVTLNLKDFPPSALNPFKIEARHPDRFLIELFDLRPELVIHCLHEQAADIGRDLAMLLNTLERIVPDFAHILAISKHRYGLPLRSYQCSESD